MHSISRTHVRGHDRAFSMIAALALVCVLGSVPAAADELLLSTPAFLPGDQASVPAAGMQTASDLARGGDQYLAVWSDGRTTPNDYEPFATEGTGTDIYGVRLDADGNPVGAPSIVINQAPGDQREPRVAWNGTHWLVVWEQDMLSLPSYEEILAVRVAPDGAVLDPTPILVHRNQSYYSSTVVVSDNDRWLVLFQANGPVEGLLGVRIESDGTVLDALGQLIHPTNFLLDFDAAFAVGEYMIVWEGGFDGPRGRRYTPDLVALGTTVLPFAQAVATDGADYLVVRASGSPPSATVDAAIVSHGGVPSAPVTLFTGGNQNSTCCADVTWDGSHYWVSWGGPTLARLTGTGVVVDPGGFTVAPSAGDIATPEFAAAPAGGVQLIYNDGVDGADYPKDIFTARVTSPGPIENENVISRSAPAQLWADFAVAEDTHFVAFQSRDSDSARILVHRLDDNGAPLDAEPIEIAAGPLPGIGTPTLGAPAVAWNGTLFLVTWSDGVKIYGRRVQPDGVLIDATPLEIMDGREPDVAAVGGVFLVVGLDFLQDNPHWQATHSMRVDGVTGANLDATPNALGGFAIFARHPHVVNWGDRWLATWQRNISHDSPGAGTTAAFVDADGTTPGLIDLPIGWRPDVAVGGGVALFVAVTGTIASATTDLEGALMGADGSLLGPAFLISNAPDKQLLPTVSWSGSEFLVAWEDKQHSTIYFDERTDIYAARVATDGTVLDPNGVSAAIAYEPETKPSLAFTDVSTLLAVSCFRTEPELGSYRLGIHVRLGATTDVDSKPIFDVAGATVLSAVPNPMTDALTIRFTRPANEEVQLRVLNAAGRVVRTIPNGQIVGTSAESEARWDGRNDAGEPVRSGIYFYDLRSGGESASGKVVVLR